MLSYFKDVLLPPKYDFRIVPSVGANDLGPLISLYLGWGRKFVVLLDGDKAGQVARDRYRTDWSLADDTVITIGDIVPALRNGAIERALSTDARTVISSEIGKSKLTKKDIAKFFQEKYAQSHKVTFDAKTLGTIVEILDKCATKLK